MKEFLFHFLTVTFLKPIIERDDGQNINSCVETHTGKTSMA